MDKFILALDQGTTSSRAIVFDKKAQLISMAQQEFTQIFPQPGWVEHDAKEIWTTQLSVAKDVIAKAGIKTENIAAIGITNQRETTVVWEKKTGEPIYNAIVWQDRRTSEYCDQLKKEGKEPLIQEKTGLVIDAYFSATKVKWILDNVPGAKTKAALGELMFGTIDSWLIYNLTGKTKHITDVTNASRTLLFNIHTLAWDMELLNLFGIPYTMLPDVKSSCEEVAETFEDLFTTKIPIAGIAGDQQAALFGQMCTEAGMVKNTYGTGCFMLMNIGEKPILSKNHLITTVAWKIKDKVNYALEGSIFIAGAVVQWLRDGLEIISSSQEVESLAKSVPNSEGVYVVPAFAGLGAPYWNQHARGTIVGITRGTKKAHIAKAALDSIAFQTMEVLKAMEADSGINIQELRVDGGATANDTLMQFQADVLGTKVVRPEVSELTALGVAYFAGLAVGFWSSIEEIKKMWVIKHSYQPDKNQNIDELIKGWNKAIKAANAWTEL